MAEFDALRNLGVDEMPPQARGFAAAWAGATGRSSLSTTEAWTACKPLLK